MDGIGNQTPKPSVGLQGHIFNQLCSRPFQLPMPRRRMSCHQWLHVGLGSVFLALVFFHLWQSLACPSLENNLSSLECPPLLLHLCSSSPRLPFPQTFLFCEFSPRPIRLCIIWFPFNYVIYGNITLLNTWDLDPLKWGSW